MSRPLPPSQCLSHIHQRTVHKVTTVYTIIRVQVKSLVLKVVFFFSGWSHYEISNVKLILLLATQS